MKYIHLADRESKDGYNTISGQSGCGLTADCNRLFCVLEELWLHIPAKQGFQRVPLWHTTLLAKCSVLYLLSRLPSKMRVSPDGNARFARQENGQVFADGDGQKAGRFQEWQWVYCLLLE
ncbi:MAG: hypothetical protein KHX60_14485 [Subdoligranulum variabile]|jgi:hypothetical protein|nr:hypothetical protein [Subdoligranulum variabile]